MKKLNKQDLLNLKIGDKLVFTLKYTYENYRCGETEYIDDELDILIKIEDIAYSKSNNYVFIYFDIYDEFEILTPGKQKRFRDSDLCNGTIRVLTETGCIENIEFQPQLYVFDQYTTNNDLICDKIKQLEDKIKNLTNQYLNIYDENNKLLIKSKEINQYVDIHNITDVYNQFKKYIDEINSNVYKAKSISNEKLDLQDILNDIKIEK